MAKQAMNPYLPLWEYVPDGEPHIFGDRLYLYGSHDVAGSSYFCLGDYVVWSAPVSDLKDWRFDGVSYTYAQTGATVEEAGNLAAPDVAQGSDRRYYLYYNRGARMGCEVAVSDKPEGPFTYLANIAFPDGSEPKAKLFDPGVLVDDDGRIYLYTGFCPTPGSPWIHVAGRYSLGFELEADMHTIKDGPYEVLPGCLSAVGTEYEGHGFYEASSPRKINGKYYMVYSSEQSHDLCYAVSDQPLGGYHYGGILVSNGDIGLSGNADTKAPCGNTHGGLVKVGDQWYIFYHRQTHGIECCRQGCAEPITLDENGVFHQAEMTSCGLNGGALEGIGRYNAAYACNLMFPGVGRLNVRTSVRDTQPHIFEAAEDGEKIHYIANIQENTLAGFKYFRLGKADAISLTLRGTAGSVEVFLDESCTIRAAELSFDATENWQTVTGSFRASDGVFPLFFRFHCEKVDWMAFTLKENLSLSM